MLKVNSIEVVYMRVIQVLRGVSLEVGEGKIVTLLGANGAGKTTTLKAISGMLKTEEGEVTQGNIDFNGKRIDRYGPRRLLLWASVRLWKVDAFSSISALRRICWWVLTAAKIVL